jgi:hypothetical protein
MKVNSLSLMASQIYNTLLPNADLLKAFFCHFSRFLSLCCSHIPLEDTFEEFLAKGTKLDPETYQRLCDPIQSLSIWLLFV